MLEACARTGDESINVSWELTESKNHIGIDHKEIYYWVQTNFH